MHIDHRLVACLLNLFVFRKLSLQIFGVNIHDISIPAIIEELSTYFVACVADEAKPLLLAEG